MDIWKRGGEDFRGNSKYEATEAPVSLVSVWRTARRVLAGCAVRQITGTTLETVWDHHTEAAFYSGQDRKVLKEGEQTRNRN